MGRILSITDDELGASATVHVRVVDGVAKTVEVTFVADDAGDLTAEVLFTLLEGIGVTLPSRVASLAQPPTPRASWTPPSKKPTAAKAASKPTAAKAAAGKASKAASAKRAPAPAQRRSYRTGPPPTAEQLQAAFKLHEGDLPAMAGQFNAGVSTVSNWLRKAREAGTVISLNGAEPATVSP